MQKQYIDERVIHKVITAIKSIRKAKKITLEVIYFDTGIHVARLEQGKTNITISTLAKLCDYFEITMSDFFKYTEDI